MATTTESLPQKPKRRWLRVLVYGVLTIVILLAGGIWYIRHLILGSLAAMDGEHQVIGLSATVEITRDQFGVPTIHCQNLTDMAFAMGWLHAQERYFQMDLQRRYTAGEMAEILGAGPNGAVMNMDKSVRVHRFRQRARAALLQIAPEQKATIEAYTQGVNQGLSQLQQPPLEYLLLQSEPSPWKPEDCLLTLYMMFLNLQHRAMDVESTMSLMHDTLPASLYQFLSFPGSPWDAPLDGVMLPPPPLPDAKEINLRLQKPLAIGIEHALEPVHVGGSNAFAVAGNLTADGKALLANDMHLEHRVPNIWYMVRIEWPDTKRSEKKRQAAGVTLPGGPVLVVGSNDEIAWGYTNSHADWLDYIWLDIDDKNPQVYLTPSGRELLEQHEETIKVKGGEDVKVFVYETKWGPVFDLDHKKRQRVLRWCAYDMECVNLDMTGLMTARSVDEAVTVANRSGGPQENILIAGADGRIVWTILGRIPKRIGFDGRLPQSWRDGRCRWDGYYAPEEAPRVVQPTSGRLWSANARQVGGANLAKLGIGDYDLPFRSLQLRDDLLAKGQLTVEDLREIQLDDRALMLQRWRQLLLTTLSAMQDQKDGLHSEAQAIVEKWNGRATPDAVGMTVVQRFRDQVLSAVLAPLVKPCLEMDKSFNYYFLPNYEAVVWRLVLDKPMHLLDASYASWDAMLQQALQRALHKLTANGQSLAQATWGKVNEVHFRHPLSAALPEILAERMNWPSWQGFGAQRDMPRIQGPKFGASMRMGVKVGDWSTGYLHMPGGESGHPMSSHYRDLLVEWRDGKATPIWPVGVAHTLKLTPSGQK